MRKTFALILALVLALAGCVAAFAEGDSWICPSCGAEATGNFCNNCGGERPDAEETVRLDLEIAFEKNAYFSTYDVKQYHGAVALQLRDPRQKQRDQNHG